MEVGVGYFIVKSIFHKDLKYGIIVIINIFLYFFLRHQDLGIKPYSLPIVS